jgi:hypothetical protein
MSRGRRGGRGRRTGRPHAGRDRAPPGAGATGHSCPCACRLRHSPASPDARRDRDYHRRRARSAAVTTAGATSPEIRTCAPCGSSISITPPDVDASAAAIACSLVCVAPGTATISTAANAEAGGSVSAWPRSARNRFRQVNRWLVFTPWSWATASRSRPEATSSRPAAASPRPTSAVAPARERSRSAASVTQGLVLQPLVRPVARRPRELHLPRKGGLHRRVTTLVRRLQILGCGSTGYVIKIRQFFAFCFGTLRAVIA